MKKILCNIMLCLALSCICFNPTIARAGDSNSENTIIESTHDEESVTSQSSDILDTDETLEYFCINNNTLSVSQHDIDLMADLVYAESRGEPFEGKIAVASVVLNRVFSSSFPNTISEVILQPNAFSCVKNNAIIAYPDQNCYDAVYSALRGNDPTNKAVFYYNPSITTCSWMLNVQKHDITPIGQHVFFKI